MVQGGRETIEKAVAAVVSDLLFAFVLLCPHVELNSLGEPVTGNYAGGKV